MWPQAQVERSGQDHVIKREAVSHSSRVKETPLGILTPMSNCCMKRSMGEETPTLAGQAKQEVGGFSEGEVLSAQQMGW